VRPRLTDEEREARRKARNAFTFSDRAYQHYNPELEGFGGPDQWEDVVRKLFGARNLKTEKTKPVNQWLASLFLEEMPLTLAELKKAFRAAMFRTHPDYGGTNEAARQTMEAFAVLSRKFMS
jgi:hypothetical protein